MSMHPPAPLVGWVASHPPSTTANARVLVGGLRPQAVAHQQRLTKPRAAQAPQSFANVPINAAASAAPLPTIARSNNCGLVGNKLPTPQNPSRLIAAGACAPVARPPVGWVRPQAVTHQQRLTKPHAAQAPQSFANAPINTAASAPHNQTSALAPHAGAH